jgi:hypothetical protein
MKLKFIPFLVLFLFIFSCAKEDIPLESVQLPVSSLYLKVGESISLTAEIEPVNATNSKLIWVSRNELVATVNSSGKISGVALGETYVVVLSSDASIRDSCEVFVNGTLTGNSGSEIITMGSGYANDIYYSMANGVVSTVPRSNWDIAFETGTWTSTIIINSGAGIKLYTYPDGDISSWNSVNINSIVNWKEMYNSDTTWNFGAFERNALGHPDYGWGIYNSVTHDVVGDSLFMIQLADQSYKKLWIKKKASVDNVYIFQFANIDGSGLVLDTVDCKPYTSKNFIYYSFNTKEAVDREPDTNNWDFVVTKYIEMIPDGNGGTVPYPVTGILTNTGVRSATLNNVPVSTTDYSSAIFVTSISEIGSDWKSFDMGTYQYTVIDDRVYFIRDKDNSVFRMVFTGFEGSSTGVIKFDKTKLN